jgi:hypothetical protein
MAEAEFKWQDALAIIGVLVGVGGMADMPIPLRLGCFVLCAICLPISFFPHKNWSQFVQYFSSMAVMVLMTFIGYRAVVGSQESNNARFQTMFAAEEAKPLTDLYVLLILDKPVSNDEMSEISFLVTIAMTSETAPERTIAFTAEAQVRRPVGSPVPVTGIRTMSEITIPPTDLGDNFSWGTKTELVVSRWPATDHWQRRRYT